MSRFEDLPGWGRELLERARVGHLGLLDDRDAPRVLPVTFAVAGGALWTAVDRKPKREGREPARVRYLRRRPNAALTVDRYDDEWSRLAWAQVLGSVDVIDAAAGAAGLAALAAKYAQYLAEPPPGPLLRIAPRRALCWRAGGAE